MLPASLDADIQFLLSYYKEWKKSDSHYQTCLLNLKKYLLRLNHDLYFKDKNYIKNILEKINKFVIVLKEPTSEPKKIEDAMAEIIEVAKSPNKESSKEIIQNIALFVLGVILGAILGFLIGTVIASLLSAVLALGGYFSISAILTDVLYTGAAAGALVTGIAFFELVYRNIEQLLLCGTIQHEVRALFNSKEPCYANLFQKKKEVDSSPGDLTLGIQFKG